MAIDRLLRNLIDKYLYEISIGLLLVVSVVIRFSLAPEVDISPDYNDYFGAWVNYYKETGLIKGLGNVIGDYYAPLNYMYALCSLLPCEPWVPLSIIPCICEYISAYFIYRIFFLLTGQKKAVHVCRRSHSVFTLCGYERKFVETGGRYLQLRSCNILLLSACSEIQSIDHLVWALHSY